MTTIIGLCGSLRRESFNGMLLRAAVEASPPGTSIEPESIREIPLYDGDVEDEQGVPPVVQRLKDRIADADGLLIVTPEYNHSMPGVLKNAIDWLSRPAKDIPRVFRGRPVAIMGATPGPGGTALSQASWLPVVRTLGMRPWFERAVLISDANAVFDTDGRIGDAAVRQRIRLFIEGFAAFAAVQQCQVDQAMTVVTKEGAMTPVTVVADLRQAGSIARHWIDGRWRDSPEHKDSIDPATGEVIGRYAVAGEEEAREATTAALMAFRETAWKTDRALRSRTLDEMADRFDAHRDELIQLVSLETGKVLPDATFEVSLAASGLRYYAALVLTESGRAAEWAAGHFSLLVREPIGVAGISAPWNAPVALMIRSLAPALAAGCTTVVNMPGKTAQLNARISEVIGEVTCLPRGVVNMVTGGRKVLGFLVTSPDVPTISFTGSTQVGRAISRDGAARLKRFGLELGGKTPMLVFDDADLEAAVPKLKQALTVFAGQFCMTGSRLLVQSGVADRVRQQLAERLSNVKVGPASDPASDMGPLIDKASVARVNQMVEDAITGGARAIVRGGPVTEGPLARGAFYRPTLLEVRDSRLPIVQQEVFGPVLTMQVFDTEAEAVALANDSEYGLAASIWSRDVDRPLRIARDLQVGTVWVNDWVAMRDEFEEGGYKQSGRGRLRGLAALDDFLEYKHIVLQPGVVAPRG